MYLLEHVPGVGNLAVLHDLKGFKYILAHTTAEVPSYKAVLSPPLPFQNLVLDLGGWQALLARLFFYAPSLPMK